MGGPGAEEEQKAGPDHLTRSPGKQEGWMFFAESGILCRFSGVWLQQSQDLPVAFEIGSVGGVHQRPGAMGGVGGRVLHAWQLQPLIWELLWYCWCHWGLVSVKI